MRQFLIAFVIVFTAALPAFAQDTPEARQAAAERYINSPGQQNMIDQMLSPEVSSAQIAAQFPQIDEEKRKKLSQIAAEELGAIRPDMEKAMIEATVEIFTVEEITALDEFYRTPAGSSVLGKMQPMMQRSFGLMGPALRKAQGNIAKRAAQLK